MTPAEVNRRAGGRRAYHKRRQGVAEARRLEVMHLWWRAGGAYGWQRSAAQRLGVSPATICRDVAAVMQQLQDDLADFHTCPFCGSLGAPDEQGRFASYVAEWVLDKQEREREERARSSDMGHRRRRRRTHL